MVRVCLLLALMVTTSGLTVLPKPSHQVTTSQQFQLDPDTFTFNATGSNSDILRGATERYFSIMFGSSSKGVKSEEATMLRRLFESGTLTQEDHGRLVAQTHASEASRRGFGDLLSASDAASAVAVSGGGTITGCNINVATNVEVKTSTTNESYTLTVAAPKIVIDAPTVFGAMYALETLSQLVESGRLINGTTITDKPRYAFRATMMDTSRHWYPLVVIKMHLDTMAYAKMNVMHWHIVDSVAFPFESTTFPSMSKTGAYSPDHVYTHEDIRELITYAMNRGIRIIPEFDTPGHVYRGWEELGVLTRCYDASGKPADTGPLNPTLNKTYEVVGGLYKEIKDVFAPEKFVHVGGDEVPSQCWNSNPQITQWMKDHPEVKGFAGLETLYEQQLLTMLKKQNTSYIVWQEIFDNGAKILPDTVIDVWKAGAGDAGSVDWQDEMANVTRAGFHTVLSAPFYLNTIHYGADWTLYYNVEPSNFTGGKEAEEKGLVGGIEACFWSEWIDSTNFISRAWPRAAAVAERAWSPKEVRDVPDAEQRIHEFRCKLLGRGINAEPIGSCLNEGCNSPLSPPAAGGTGYAGFCPREFVPVYRPPF